MLHKANEPCRHHKIPGHLLPGLQSSWRQTKGPPRTGGAVWRERLCADRIFSEYPGLKHIFGVIGSVTASDGSMARLRPYKTLVETLVSLSGVQLQCIGNVLMHR